MRKVPKSIESLLGSLSNSVQVGIVKRVPMDEVIDGALSHLAVPARVLTVGESFSILPPVAAGRQSAQNRNGLVVVRRDLPKVPKTIDMGPRPIWGDWSNGSFDLVITRHVFQKENRPAANLQLATRVLAIEDIGEPHAVLFTTVSATLDQSTPNFLSELLAHLRLLKESCGACDVLNAAVTDNELLKRIYVNWEILPPGQRDATIARILGSIKNPTSAEKQRMIDRHDNLAALNPEQWVVGQGGFDRYFGAVFPDHVALENVEYGNALYIMVRDKWEELSQLSRTELLSGARDGFTRIPHVGDWKNKVKAAIY